jgi:LacI family transcriptional regulator
MIIYALGCTLENRIFVTVKRLTRKDIAAEAGVSPSTVSRALSGSPLLPDATIGRIRDIAGRMGYKPNALAGKLARNKSFQIGFAAPLGLYGAGPIAVPYYSALLDAMVKTAYKRDYNVSIIPFEEDSEDTAGMIGSLIDSKHLDGVIFAGLKKDSRMPSLLTERRAPVVVVGFPGGGGFPVVNCLPEPGVLEAADYIRETGHSKIYYIHGDMSYYDAGGHLAAFKKAMKTLSFTAWEIVEGNYSRTSGSAAAGKILSSSENKGGKICVMTANDRMAAGVYRRCHRDGVSIPADLAVCGSDDDLLATILYPELSTIRQPRNDMGSAAAETIIDMIEKKSSGIKDTELPMRFIKRDSI